MPIDQKCFGKPSTVSLSPCRRSEQQGGALFIAQLVLSATNPTHTEPASQPDA